MAELYYIQVPRQFRPVVHSIEFMALDQFLHDEPACRALWDLIDRNFKTRSKFLATWPSVRYLAVYYQNDEPAGFLMVSAPINWQIDYVVVREDARHRGVAASLVNETLNQALARGVPYVMLTSKDSLRPLYEGQCGFSVVESSQPQGLWAELASRGLKPQAVRF